MPAHVVLVDDNSCSLATLGHHLRVAGYNVAAFANAIEAFDVLTGPGIAEVLVTRMRFPPGQPHGRALAGAGRMRRPALKVVFVDDPEWVSHGRGFGQIVTLPAEPGHLVKIVDELFTDALPFEPEAANACPEAIL